MRVVTRAATRVVTRAVKAATSGDTSPCRMTGVTLHSHVRSDFTQSTSMVSIHPGGRFHPLRLAGPEDSAHVGAIGLALEPLAW